MTAINTAWNPAVMPNESVIAPVGGTEPMDATPPLTESELRAMLRELRREFRKFYDALVESSSYLEQLRFDQQRTATIDKGYHANDEQFKATKTNADFQFGTAIMTLVFAGAGGLLVARTPNMSIVTGVDAGSSIGNTASTLINSRGQVEAGKHTNAADDARMVSDLFKNLSGDTSRVADVSADNALKILQGFAQTFEDATREMLAGIKAIVGR